MTKNNKKKIKLLKVSLFTILCSFIFGVLFLFVIFIFTSSYLKSGKFKRFIETKISQNLNIEGEFDKFNWSGPSLNSNEFSAKGYADNPLSKIRRPVFIIIRDTCQPTNFNNFIGIQSTNLFQRVFLMFPISQFKAD